MRESSDVAKSPQPAYKLRSDLRTLYPPIACYESGLLQVDEIHSIYYECSGNSKGWPIIFLHGGPGGGMGDQANQFFDPHFYKIVAFDQRGCGKSIPKAELRNNTTSDLIEDIEKLRKKLKIEKMHVLGGSWGTTLALLYAQAHPDRVSALILRGVYLFRPWESSNLYQRGGGTSLHHPDAFDKYESYIPEEERGDLITAYHKRLHGSDKEVQAEAAKHWVTWEESSSSLYLDKEGLKKVEDDPQFTLALALIENHYFYYQGFISPEQVILKPSNMAKIQDIPAIIVQGRYDCICPPTIAYELKKAYPKADLRLIPDAGHSSMEPGNLAELVMATDRLRGVN